MEHQSTSDLLKKKHQRIITSNRPKQITNYLSQDNSLAKAVLLKEKQEISINQLTMKKKVLNFQSSVRTVAIRKRELQEHWDLMIQEKLNHIKNLDTIQNLAAKIIQRHVRGLLVRIHTEEAYINMFEKKSEILIKESSAQALTIMLNLGVVLVPATISIQKAYRRYLGRKKIHILQICYEKYLSDRLEIQLAKIKHGMRMMVCKTKRYHFVFLNFREERMIAIKRKLAILQVKGFWRSKKLTFKTVKEKIQRIKRKQAALQNKEAYAKIFNQISGKTDKTQNKITIGSEEDKKSESDEKRDENENLDEDEFLEAQRLKEMIQKKIQDKINKSKVSHGITGTKNVMILPLMQEKALKESPSSEINKLMNITASVFAKGIVLSRERKKPSRSLVISSPPCYEHKRVYGEGENNLPYMRSFVTPEPGRVVSPPKGLDYADFMASTLSSKRKEYKKHWKIPDKKAYLNLPVGSNLIIPTVACTLKQSKKKDLAKIRGLSFGSAKDKYIPSFNNTSYSPTPWKPLPLNKNILVHTGYGSISYKSKLKPDKYSYNDPSRSLTPDLPLISKRDLLYGRNYD